MHILWLRYGAFVILKKPPSPAQFTSQTSVQKQSQSDETLSANVQHSCPLLLPKLNRKTCDIALTAFSLNFLFYNDFGSLCYNFIQVSYQGKLQDKDEK